MTPCGSCEMRSSCLQAGRCCRPRTIDSAINEVSAAVQQMEAAMNRLVEANKGLLLAYRQIQPEKPT